MQFPIIKVHFDQNIEFDWNKDFIFFDKKFISYLDDLMKQNICDV